jgi:hypothetical protein
MMVLRMVGKALLFLATLSVALAPGHGAHASVELRGLPDETARSHGWESLWIAAGRFDLLAYREISEPGAAVLTVYLESDGFAWVSSSELSDDPTPRVDRVLRMAVQDDGANTAYLARPCFYLDQEALENCPSQFWSLARYGEEVVAALDIALDRLKADAGARTLRLVGVSGGGVLAALLAARRDDVAGLITVTGNLDHAVWTARNGVTPLRDSLNAADVAAEIEDIPQVHFIGADDTNVQRADVDAFLARMADRSRAHLVVVPGQNHVCCWLDRWPELLEQAERLMAD